MSKIVFDIDLDLPPSVDKEKYGIRAIIYDKDNRHIRPHPSGRYIGYNIPVDGETGMAAVEYKEAEAAGYIKLDLLTNTSYGIFKDKEDYLKAIAEEPDWEILWTDEIFVNRLPQISKHFTTLKRLKPKSIEDLADVLAMIRPAKKHLVKDYNKDKEKIKKELFVKPADGVYYFKKSHAVSYAVMIVGVMNRIANKKISEFFIF